MSGTPASLLLWPAGGILDIREAYRVKFATGLPRETNDVSQTAGDDVGSRLARDRALHITFVPVLHATFPCSHRHAVVQAGMPANELASRRLNSRPDAGLVLSALHLLVTGDAWSPHEGACRQPTRRAVFSVGTRSYDLTRIRVPGVRPGIYGRRTAAGGRWRECGLRRYRARRAVCRVRPGPRGARIQPENSSVKWG